MYLSLLTDADAAAGGSSTWMSWVLIGLVIVAFIAMIVFSSRRNKKRPALLRQERPSLRHLHHRPGRRGRKAFE